MNNIHEPIRLLNYGINKCNITVKPWCRHVLLLSLSLISTFVTFGDSRMVSDSSRGLSKVRWANKVSLWSIMLSLMMETFTACLVSFLLKTNRLDSGS